MAKIVRIIDMMDHQLACAIEDGREPQRFILREEDWREIQQRFEGDRLLYQRRVGDSYKGVAVHFGVLRSDDLVMFVDRLLPETDAFNRPTPA